MRNKIGEAEQHVELRESQIQRKRIVKVNCTSITATVTTLWYVGMRRSMLRYLSTSDRACVNRSKSWGSCVGEASFEMNSPRSGACEDTVAQPSAEIMLQM